MKEISILIGGKAGDGIRQAGLNMYIAYPMPPASAILQTIKIWRTNHD